MTFSEALELIKKGERLQRKGWNGKGMFVFLVPGSLVVDSEGAEITHLPYINMRTTDSSVVPWLASQTDILADDWQTVMVL